MRSNRTTSSGFTIPHGVAQTIPDSFQHVADLAHWGAHVDS